MTKIRIKRLMKEHGIQGELTGRGMNWEVEVANEREMRRFTRLVSRVGGYRTGYGSWVLRPGTIEMGDWNDQTSRWHY